MRANGNNSLRLGSVHVRWLACWNMDLGTRSANVASWLVGCVVAFAFFPQTPAKAASSSVLPDAVVAALEGAAPGIDLGMIGAVWHGPGQVLGIEASVDGLPIQFKVSELGDLIWIGRPGEVGPHSIPAAEGGVGTIPAAVGNVSDLASGALPHLVISSIARIAASEAGILHAELRQGRTPIFIIVLDEGNAGLLSLSVKASGAIVAMDRDSDRDGLYDAYEFDNGLDPYLADSDGDRYPDGFEVEHGSDPAAADSTPPVLTTSLDLQSRVLVVAFLTFPGMEFSLETQRDDGTWGRLGETVSGDGALHEVAVPTDGFVGRAMFRLGIVEPKDGGETDDEDETDESASCSVPGSLQNHELVVSGGRRLCFKSGRKGEVLEGAGGAMVVTPFAYVFKRSGHCRAKVTLTFSTPRGFETTVYQLTFGTNGTAGAYVVDELQAGSVEDSSSGFFTLTMNDPSSDSLE